MTILAILFITTNHQLVVMWSLNLSLIPPILPEVEKSKKSFYKKSALKNFPNFNANIRDGVLTLVKQHPSAATFKIGLHCRCLLVFSKQLFFRAGVYFLKDEDLGKKVQNQLRGVFCKKRRKFRKFHRKTPVLESLFDNVVGLRLLTYLLKRDSNKGVFLINLRNSAPYDKHVNTMHTNTMQTSLK